MNTVDSFEEISDQLLALLQSYQLQLIIIRMTGIKFSFYSPSTSSSPAEVVKESDGSIEVEVATVVESYSGSDECGAASTLSSHDSSNVSVVQSHSETIDELKCVKSYDDVKDEKAIEDNNKHDDDYESDDAIVSPPSPTLDDLDQTTYVVPDEEGVDGSTLEKVPDENKNETNKANAEVVAATESITTPVESISIPSTDSHNVSSKLTDMMKERLQVVDSIRNLLETEQKSSTLIAEYTNKVVVSKDETIVALNEHIEDIEAKNADYAEQLNALSSMINKLVDDNNENIELIKSQMTDEMSAQKTSFEKEIEQLNTITEEANASYRKTKTKNEKLEETIDKVKTNAAKLADDTATSVGQIEKDLDEEFQVTTQLKRDMEDLKKKFTKEDNEEGANEIENLLANLRKVQVWQLSHFQRIGNLVFKNKEHARGLQSL